jgi:hypothetical protein
MDTSLESVPCTLVLNHVEGDPHAARCTGRVFAHRDPTICEMVLRHRS